MKTLALLILFFQFVSLSGQAVVNMRNGSYAESWIDFLDPQEGYEMKIERFYSSRSLFSGLFGFGWCSELETHLEITSDGIINLTECGGGLEVTYYPEDFDLQSPKQTIEAITKFIAKEKKLSSNDVINLKAQLRSNPKMRFTYANRLHLVDVKKVKSNKNTFQAKSKGVEKIIYDGKIYERKKYDGSTERFNAKGQLIQLVNPRGLWLKLNYKGSKLAYLVDNKGRRLNFTYDTNGKLKSIFNGRGLSASYRFQGENLVEVKNMWTHTYTFEYDNNHNMTAVGFPDKTRIRMTYDLANDWIKSYTTRDNCREEYQFLLSQSDPKNHYWGTFKRKCKDQQAVSGKHEFWYKSYSFSNDKYLYRVQEKVNSDFKDVIFHPYLGRPVTVRDNNLYMGYSYYLNGLVNKKEFKRYSSQQEILDWYRASYKYDLSIFKIIESNRNILNKLGKITGARKTFFEYDRRGLLKKAKVGKNQFVRLLYDSTAKIKKISNHKGIKIALEYEPGKEKPAKMKQSGLGEVQITYNGQGDVEKVESKPKRNVASSIIENFLEMIEFLGPLGDSLKI